MTFWNALAIGLASNILPVIINLCIYRLIKRRDTKIDLLAGRVKQLEEEKIAVFDERITAATQSRKELHTRMDRLDEKYVTRRECAGAQDRIEELRGEVHSQRAILSEVQDTSARSEAMLSLIVNRLDITLQSKGARA